MEECLEYIVSVVEFVEKRMDWGEGPCPFCGNCFIHQRDCLYTAAVKLLAQKKE